MPLLSPSLFEELAREESQRKRASIAYKSNLLQRVFPILCGSTNNIPHAENMLFDGLDQIIKDIPLPQPALYDGTLLVEIDEAVRDDLQHLIMPSAANPQAPAVPNFFVEIKAPNEDKSLVRCRAWYNGALGARAIRSLKNYGRDEPIYDGNIDTVTVIYDPETGILQIYCTHITRSSEPGPSVAYHMTEMGSWNVIDSRESFVRGATAFRNARDTAKDRRDRAIKEANAKALELRAGMVIPQ